MLRWIERYDSSVVIGGVDEKCSWPMSAGAEYLEVNWLN